MSTRVHRILNRMIPAAGKSMLRRAALQLIPTMRHLDTPTRLRHLADLGFAPGVIHDIGAACGDWARLAHGVFPRARIFAFEPNIREKPALDRVKREIPNFEYKIGFLGQKPGIVRYTDDSFQTSILKASGSSGSAASEMYVLDELIESGEVPAPDFMKLDVQGFELEVLRGAERAVKSASAILLEVSFIEFLPGVPLIEEVLCFMAERGYFWYDAMELTRRPDDDALWQMDVLFARRTKSGRWFQSGGE